MKFLSHQILILLLMALFGTVSIDYSRATERVLRIGDQKGGLHALMNAANVLDISYRIEWMVFPAAAPLFEALRSGAIDAGWVGDAPFVFAAAASAPVKAIYAARADGTSTAILAAPQTPIHIPEDLKGKRIAVARGSIGHYILARTLESAHLSLNDVRPVFLAPADSRAALKSGFVDAWATWEPYTAQSEQEDGTRRIIDGGKGLLSGLIYLVAANKAVVTDNDLLADFIRRLARAHVWAQAHLDDYAVVWAKETGLSETIARHALGRLIYSPVAIDDHILAEQQDTVAAYARTKIIPAPFDTSPFFDTRFNEVLLH